MSIYFLSYDLRQPGRDYQKLYDELKSYKAVRVMESVWCFKSSSTAGALRDHFKDYIDSNDRLLVVKEDGWGTWGAMKTPSDL